MELGLNDFLSQLGSDTVSRINRETKSKEIPGTEPVKENKTVNIPKRQPVKQPEVILEDEKSEELDEEFVETALDYANVIVKTIRKSFDTKEQRRKVMESVRAAVDVYLNEYNKTSYSNSSSGSLFPQRQGKMTEAEFNSMPTMTQ